MLPLRVAIAVCVIFAAPSALLAQTTQSTTQQAPHVRPIPPAKRPHPGPTGASRYRPSHPRRSNAYPVVIDGSFFNRYLATPTPAPKRKPTPRPKNNGQDVFETHSTDDAK